VVNNIGDGRAAIYTKKSNTPGDWSQPAYLTGPKGDQGEAATISIGAVIRLAPGDEPTVSNSGTSGDAVLDFGLPDARGFYQKGDYDTDETYQTDDVVLFGGSSWTARQETTGNPPPALPDTSNEWWQLLAEKGEDGTGTGDVKGPDGATDGEIVLMNGATGRLIKGSGKGIGDLIPADGSISNAKLAAVPAKTLKGNDEAVEGPANDLTLTQLLTMLGILPAANIPGDLSPDKAFRRGNIIGTVSQAGGVPTGAVIERGSNANGEYARWADGTQICWLSDSIDMSVGNAYGAFFQGTVTWNYAAIFIDRPSVQCSLRWGSSASWASLGGTPTASDCTLRCIDYASRASGPTYRTAIAIGRWF